MEKGNKMKPRFGIGVVVTQIQNGQKRVIAYISQILSDAVRNYLTTEQKCLAVIMGYQEIPILS